MSSNLNYYITLDSNYRDREKYPLETDFAVTFETKDPSLQYPQGQPVDSTQFFPRVTIDKNFDSSNIRVLNGKITSMQYDVNTGETLYAGIQIVSGESNNFLIYNDQDIIYSQFQNISIAEIPGVISNFQAFKDQLQLPFLFKLNSSNEFIWLVLGALSEVERQTYVGLNKTIDVKVEINNSGDYLLAFDYQSNLSFYKYVYENNTTTTINLGYNIVSPYGNGLSAYAVTAFTTDGFQLVTNGNPWGYHNFYTTSRVNAFSYSGTNCSSPFNMLSTSLDNNTTNCIKSDKGNSIYIGVNIDNITPSYTSINLDGPAGYTGATNTPIYYPDTTFPANKWQPLSFTYINSSYDFFSPTLPQTNNTISQSIVICNTTNLDSSYTGTSLLFPILLQKNLPVRNFYVPDYDANFQRSQQYQRFFTYATGTYTSGPSTTYTGNVCYTNIDNIFTASFYPPQEVASTVGRIFCDNKPFGDNAASIVVLQYTLVPFQGTYNITQEQTYQFIPPGSGIMTINGISAIRFMAINNLLFMSRSDTVTNWLTALTYDTTTFTFSVYSNLVTIFNFVYVGAYNDEANGLMVGWATDYTFPINFYNISGGTFTLVGTLNPNLNGNRTGMRVYERRTGPLSSEVSYYFTLSIDGNQYTYSINVAAGPSFTFTLITTCEGKNISNSVWFDHKNYKEYLITSNPELSVYSFYNNILGKQVGQNNQIEAFNSVYYVPQILTSGDLYATTIESNTFVTSWGSLLQNPELVSSHVYQNPKVTITLPKDILATATFQLNNRLYVVYAYDLPITFPVYLYVYDITDINNYIFIGTISTDSTVLPIVRINAIGFNNTVFILCESDVTKCIIFTIDAIESYTSEDIDIVPINPKYSNFLIVNDELYIYQAKVVAAGNFELTKYKYNGSTFPVNSTATLSSGYASVTVHQVADLYYFLTNQYKIIVLISDGSSSTSNYDLYFIDFNVLSSVTYIINTPLQQETAGTLLTVQFNEINYTNQIFFNYEYSPTRNYIAIYEVPAEIGNISLTTLLNSNIPVPFGGIQAKFSTIYNITSDEIFLVVQVQGGIVIYNTTNPSSISFLAQLDNTLYNTINSIITTVFNTVSYTIVTYKYSQFGADEQYYSDIIQITNPLFAQNYSVPTRVETTSIIYGKGPSALVKINYEGQTQWINSIGDVYPYTGQAGELDSQYCNIAGLVLNNSDLSIAVSTSWVAKLAEVNYQKTFESNLLTNPFNSIIAINACLFKFRTDNGNAEFALPIEGVLDTYITNPVNLNDNFTLSPTFNSSNLYIYAPQTSRTTNLTSLSNPITIQKTLTNITYQAASVVSLTQSGVLSWTSVIQSQNINSYVFSYTIGSVNNTLTMLTTTFKDNVNIYDNSNTISQVVYPFTQTASNNYIINIRYNSSGTYLESDSIESPNIPSLIPFATSGNSSINKIIYSNAITTYSTGSPDSLYYRNKDGTLGHVDNFVGQNVYYVKELLTSPGVYNRTIPTGCIGVKVKLWGSGGSVNSTSMFNTWTAFGGGGGFAERQLTYPEGTPFNIKIGAAGNGGSSVLNSSLAVLGGFGGESSYCHSYVDGNWNVEIVAGGGGGAGAGATGGILFVSTGSNGGSAGYPGNRGLTTAPPPSITFPGLQGINGGGGLGGDIAGTPPSQNGRNFINYSSSYYSTLGTGGTSSYDGSPSAYTFTYAGGAGGAGYGGGGGGDPGASAGPFTLQSCGGGGGGSYGARVVYKFSNEANWLPANSADIDFYALNPLYLLGVFNYAQGGWPTLNVAAQYNPTGGNGLGVIYYYYSSNTGLTGAAYNTQTAISSYKYDSTFIDQNLKSYSSLTVYKNSSNIDDTFTPYQTGAQTGSFINYYTYILGTGTNTPLNKNFLIRNNYYDDDEYTVVLDQKIDTTKLTRTYSLINYDPNSIYFYSSNISKTPVTSVLNITGTNPLIVNYTSSPINLRDRYYVLCQTSTGSVDVITVNSISYTGGNYYIYYTGTNNCSGSYVYLSKFNNSALWNLQFNPTSIYTPVYYQVTLQRLTLPNRPIKNGPNPGIRYLTDYPYVFLQVYNTNDNDDFDPENINNIYTNNPNGPPVGGYDQNPTAYPNNSVYTIDISTSPGGEANFLFFNSGFIPRLKFSPGYYNIKLRLLDPDGNVILFDNTPVKNSDSVFSGVVDPSLMRMVVQLVFKKAT
uniref:Glycine-rich domain-containing protein n=1 Tax=viral metagenome TaxID=1070528 RepID=A0A6C0HEV7_9ZZZZ